MKLSEFINCYGSLSPDAFLDHFRSPFLLQLDVKGNPHEAVYVLRSLEGSPLILGRARSCHCRLAASSVSNRHARLCPPRLEGEPWIVIDEGSSNGSFVNGTALQPSEPMPLADRDQLELGPDTRLQFVTPQSFLTTFRQLVSAQGGFATEPSTLDKPTDEHDVDAAHPHEAETCKARIAPPDSDLVIWCPPFDPIPLTQDSKVILGRSAKVSDFVLPDTEVSRRHAEILRNPEGVFVRDLQSANGTRVGSADVGQDLTRLLCEEPIFIGPYRLTVRLLRPERETREQRVVDVGPDEATTPGVGYERA